MLKNKKTLIIIAVIAIIAALAWYFGFLAKIGIGPVPLNRANVEKYLRLHILGNTSWKNHVQQDADKKGISWEENVIGHIRWTIDEKHSGNLQTVWDTYKLSNYV